MVFNLRCYGWLRLHPYLRRSSFRSQFVMEKQPYPIETRSVGHTLLCCRDVDESATLDDEELCMLLRLLPAGEALTLIVVRRLQIGRGPLRCLLVGSAGAPVVVGGAARRKLLGEEMKPDQAIWGSARLGRMLSGVLLMKAMWADGRMRHRQGTVRASSLLADLKKDGTFFLFGHGWDDEALDKLKVLAEGELLVKASSCRDGDAITMLNEVGFNPSRFGSLPDAMDCCLMI
ncbi:hypothetical protein ACLOJK_037267 [Asimina triloba]